jgi:hypothetical protein
MRAARLALLAAALAVAACGGGAGATDGAPAADGGPPDAGAGDGAPPVEGGPDGGGDGSGPDGPGCGAAECTCALVPADPATACWHSLGGRYADGACSASYQCCGGAFVAGTGSCGACTCTEATGELGCVPPAAGVEVCYPTFAGSVAALGADLEATMTGSSWRAGCPVALGALAHVTFTHLGFDGAAHPGEVVVAAGVADVVLDVFRRLYAARFPIAKARLIDEYGASDDASMADDNTSAFNCRAITGGTSWSEHSYGDAIDINPIENPYVKGATVLPPAGAAYTDRADVRPGMIVEPGPVTGAFRVHGWVWGGSWTSPKDYQHFSANGR